MWPFKSIKSLKESGMFNGFIDWHSHILPGVDDGIHTMEDALKVLNYYEALGIRKIWLTPHIMEDIPNETGALLERYQELLSVWKGKIELKLAAENMLDSMFEERLENDDVLPIGEEGQHLLVETSYYTPPMGMEEMFERIKSKGFYPVLAHPERYRYMEEKDYKRLKDSGVLFQLNYASLVGGYGETARKKAEWLLDKHMINVLGSDLHRYSAIEPILTQSPKKQRYLDFLSETSRYLLE